MAVRPDNWFRRLLRRSAATPAGSWFYARTLHHIDRAVYRLSRGRVTFSSWAAGLPVVMLTTTGAKSGIRRTVPVLGIREGDDVVVVASNYGQRHAPAWYHNLRARPRATIALDGVTREVEPVELRGEDYERYARQARDIYAGFESYQQRAGREIPIIRLRAIGRPQPDRTRAPTA